MDDAGGGEPGHRFTKQNGAARPEKLPWLRVQPRHLAHFMQGTLGGGEGGAQGPAGESGPCQACVSGLSWKVGSERPEERGTGSALRARVRNMDRSEMGGKKKVAVHRPLPGPGARGERPGTDALALEAAPSGRQTVAHAQGKTALKSRCTEENGNIL